MIHIFCHGMTHNTIWRNRYLQIVVYSCVLFKEGFGMKLLVESSREMGWTQQEAVLLAATMGAEHLTLGGKDKVMIHTNVRTLANKLARYAIDENYLIHTHADMVFDLSIAMGHREWSAQYTSADHMYMDLAKQIAREHYDKHERSSK